MTSEGHARGWYREAAKPAGLCIRHSNAIANEGELDEARQK